ncbi:hypothetical protein [Pseudorhodoplanes sp.]|uniref:hypothetical protein n=1 Tax=Pseudorhodoplanes sp. TaxID=1934341 RepID=UPI00391DC68C
MSAYSRHLTGTLALHAVPLDENRFVDWIVDAKAHDCIAYYRGHLALDRCESTGVLSPTDRRRLATVANRVMVASGQGLVFPVQKRLGPHDYLYLAVRALGRLGTAAMRAPRIVPLKMAA